MDLFTKETETRLSKDGTLIVTIDDFEEYQHIGRILVECGTSGTLYYSDNINLNKSEKVESDKSDLISRKDLLDVIDANIGILYDNPTLIHNLKELANNLQSVQEWIPTELKLPEKDGLYFVTYLNGVAEIELAFYHTEDNSWYGFKDGDIVEEFWRKVVAWKELPEPYDF